MKINIEKLRIINKPEAPHFKALVDIKLEDSLILEDIKLLEYNDKLFIAMASKKNNEGVYKDIYHPLTLEFREELTNFIIDAFKFGKYEIGELEGLNITETRIKKITGSSNGLVAIASIFFNQKFVVHNIALVQKIEGGLTHNLVFMPNRKINEEYRNLAYAIKEELRSEISDKILEEYEKIN